MSEFGRITDEMDAQITQLKAENNELRAGYDATAVENFMKFKQRYDELERKVRELEADKARLDWWGQNPQSHPVQVTNPMPDRLHLRNKWNYKDVFYDSMREAIDAALRAAAQEEKFLKEHATSAEPWKPSDPVWPPRSS